MCYLVREESSASEPRGDGAPARPERVRPRLAGVAAALLVGGFALAALLAPARVSPLSTITAQQAPVKPAVMATQAGVPATGGLERTALPADDGVPSAPDTVRAGMAPCNHGM